MKTSSKPSPVKVKRNWTLIIGLSLIGVSAIGLLGMMMYFLFTGL